MKMKIKNLILKCTAFLLIFSFTTSCSKKKEADEIIPSNVWLSVTTSGVDNITNSSVRVRCWVSEKNSIEVTESGVCIGTSVNPTTNERKLSNGAQLGNFNVTITGLNAYRIYHVRAYAINSQGVTYGKDIQFTTLVGNYLNPSINYGSISDIDGNSYATVAIGTQIWMAENLKTSKYRDGSIIPLITLGPNDNYDWQFPTTGVCTDYDNDPVLNSTYGFGKLYNWLAVNDSRGLCPTGWHVPSDDEWTTLSNFLGGDSISGLKLKSTVGWGTGALDIYLYANNESGFSAMAGGFINQNGTEYIRGYSGLWWSNTINTDNDLPFGRSLMSENTILLKINDDGRIGLSVRCLKD